MNAPNITAYDDFRHYLRDLYQFKKQSNSRYSYRKLATDLGFSPSNFLYLVISEKRKLSEDAIAKICKHSPWTAKQKKYFKSLVLCNQESDESKKSVYKKDLKRISNAERQLIDPDQYAYFSTWYLPVLREIIGLKSFVSNLIWIAKKIRPHVDEDKLKKAFAVLERLKMVRRDKKNCWTQSSEHLTTPTEVTSSMVHNYHSKMLDLSKMALQIPASERDISSTTVGVSKEQFKWLKKRIVDFRDDVLQELQDMDDKSEMVAQLNIQFFPVTED